MLADCVHQLGRAPQYFRTLAVIVCNRSELIAGEKRLMRISELLLIKEVQTAKKSRECEQMKKSHRRDELRLAAHLAKEVRLGGGDRPNVELRRLTSSPRREEERM